MRKKVRKDVKKRRYICGGIMLIALALFLLFARLICKETLRLDQYATTIFATTAGVVGSMFGLTAASYAFIWGDLRTDSQANRHLERVLKNYKEELRKLFYCSLILTMIVIFSSLIGLAFAQKITEPDLYKTIYHAGEWQSFFYNGKPFWISMIALLNLVISFIAIVVMGLMNGKIFGRNAQYASLAENILEEIDSNYNMEIKENEGNEGNPKNDVNSLEYKKIHNLEILIERILKNHESLGDAFAESQRREKLLTSVIMNGLEDRYALAAKGDEVALKEGTSAQSRMEWEYLEDRKRKNRWDKCLEQATEEYGILLKPLKKEKSQKLPRECSFISVYEDLLGYRDNSLIYEENCSKKKKKDIEMKERRALRYTIKRRLLVFYLQGEAFSNMDLSGISFSGADLRFTNFSNCNLTGIRLMGANCEGADFTGAKMTGMYFADVTPDEDRESGEIKLTYKDDMAEIWDPYEGEEATCLREATFKEADVSRAYLKAPGEPFPMYGTNFDSAKMFFSYFKNIDFTNASLERAQMYNTGLVQVRAKSANFASATLTNACIAWCDFNNADFTAALLAETILMRVDFHGAKLKDANFSYSNIVDCNFEGASCQNVSFKNMIQDTDSLKKETPKALKDIDICESQGIRFDYAILTNTDFSGAILDHISFANVIGQDCIFTKATGKNVDFSCSLFASSIFNATRLESCCLKNTIFRDSVFIKTEFVNSFFDKVDFSKILVNSAGDICFTGGCMREVDFSDAVGLTAACFRTIILCGVDFSGTGIRKCDFYEDVKLDDACIF